MQYIAIVILCFRQDQHDGLQPSDGTYGNCMILSRYDRFRFSDVFCEGSYSPLCEAPLLPSMQSAPWCVVYILSLSLMNSSHEIIIILLCSSDNKFCWQFDCHLIPWIFE